jgi:hypothetical protein
MKKIFLKENDLIRIVEKIIKEAGDLYTKHKFGKDGEYCVIFIKKEDLRGIKAKYLSSFAEIITPKKYFLSQYYDGTCCFITEFEKYGGVKPVLFDSEKSAKEELDFMFDNSPKLMNQFIPKIVIYNSNKWK